MTIVLNNAQAARIIIRAGSARRGSGMWISQKGVDYMATLSTNTPKMPTNAKASERRNNTRRKGSKENF